jgi:uncharacterized YceG family protein
MSPLFGGKSKDEQPAGPRSAAEREAARLERERRRAEREGRPSEPGTPPPEASPDGPDPLRGGGGDAAPPEEPVADEPPPPVFDEPPVVRYEPQAAEPEPQPEPEPAAYAPEPEPEQAYEPDPDPDPAAYAPAEAYDEPEGDQPTYEQPVYAPEPVTVPADHEQPAALRRVGAPSVRDLPQVAGARPVGAAVRKPPKRRRRWAARILALVVLAVILAAGYLLYRVLQPGHDAGDAQRPVTVVVPNGSTAGEIADLLEQRGVIDSSFYFGLRARLDGKRDQLKAGTFALKHDMSYKAVLAALTANPKAAPVVHVAIPEGRSISEEAPLIKTAGLTGSYRKAAERNPRTVKGFKGYGVPRGTRTMEGFLFPATYELKRKGASARALVDQQLAAFRRNFDGLNLSAAKRKNLSAYDVLIIASMIEREAQVPKDRALISAVIYNRLKQHIPLGIDATLRYHLNNWSRPLRQSELKADSAFNTRTRQGLPPTPIGSPGLASIKAALKPAKVPYIFYVVKPCGNGAHAFSASDAQFEKDVAAYNRKREQLGGKDPSHC